MAPQLGESVGTSHMGYEKIQMDENCRHQLDSQYQGSSVLNDQSHGKQSVRFDGAGGSFANVPDKQGGYP